MTPGGPPWPSAWLRTTKPTKPTLLGGPTEAPADESRKEPMMPEHRGRFKKSAIGASSVTLIPSTASPAAMGEGAVSQIVVSTGGATPPGSFWGSAVADGIEYEVIFQRKS
jgi:hypothetical protein